MVSSPAASTARVSERLIPASAYCCPRCKADLEETPSTYSCVGCAASYPVVLGIPDFRTHVPEDEQARERDAVATLVAEYDRAASFGELLKPYLMRTTSAYLLGVEFRYELGWKTRAMDIQTRIDGLREQTGWDPETGVCLDVGCGKGAILASVAAGYRASVGLEYSLEYLILAKKLLETEGIRNVRLVCASAEDIPFRDGTFDMVLAVDVIEHIPDAARAAREMHRTLRPGGLLYLNSPNRYNVFTPEDHVQLMFVGFLPRRWMKPYIYWRKKSGYEGVWLKSLGDLRRILGALGGEYHMLGVMATKYGAKHSMVKGLLLQYPFVLRFVNALLKPVIPSYNVLFKKNA